LKQVDIRRVVERIQNLPTLPIVVSQILRLVGDDESSAHDVQEILRRDQSLTFKILKIVNSSFYGNAGKIRDLQHAVVILGFDTIKSVALSATIFSTFPNGKRGRFDREAFWRHSIAVAVASRKLAQELKITSFEEAFVGGILHDIGKVVLDEYASELFEEVLTYVEEKKVLMYEAERAVCGFSHAQIGRWIAAKWALPQEYVDVIFYHHQPGNAQKATQLTAIVHLGDIIARSLKIGSGGDDCIPPIDPSSLKILSLSEETIKKVIIELPAEFEKADLFAQMSSSD